MQVQILPLFVFMFGYFLSLAFSFFSASSFLSSCDGLMCCIVLACLCFLRCVLPLCAFNESVNLPPLCPKRVGVPKVATNNKVDATSLFIFNNNSLSFNQVAVAGNIKKINASTQVSFVEREPVFSRISIACI